MPKTLRTPRQQRLRELLADVRKARKLTQADVAERLGRPQSFVAKYEGGERRLDIVEFVEVAEALETDPCALLVEPSSRRRAFAPSVSRPPFKAGTEHRPAVKQSKVSGGPTRVGPSRPHVINISLRASMRDRYRDRRADQLRSIRKRDGVVPVSFRKLSVKWLWLAKPTASATSAIDRSAPSSSSLPRRMRRSIR